MTSSSITGGHLSDHHSDRVVEGSKSLESKSTVSLSEEIYNRSRDDKDPDDERGATSVVLKEKCSFATHSPAGILARQRQMQTEAKTNKDTA